MDTSFKNILLPVNFTFNTQVAVKKAIELIEADKADIHLLHIMKPAVHFSFHPFRVKMQEDGSGEAYSEANRKLKQWKRVVEETLTHVTVHDEIVFSANLTNAIIKKAVSLQPDLIILGEHTTHTGLFSKRKISTAKIALKTGIPLMILKPGCIYNKVKSVVVPVAGFTPQRKIELLMALRKRFRMRVHLVTIMDSKGSENDFSAPALLETYQILKNNLQFPVEYQVLHGRNRAKVSLQYAESIGADMLLVNPDTETKVTTFTGVHINDMLLPESRLQILEVDPKKINSHKGDIQV